MTGLPHASIAPLELPGLRHRTIASPRDALRTMAVRRQTIAPGEATPLHKHDCEGAVVILGGSVRLEIEAKSQGFGTESSLILEADASTASPTTASSRSSSSAHSRHGAGPGGDALPRDRAPAG